MIGVLYSYATAKRAAFRRAAVAEDLGVPVVWDSGAWSVHTGKAKVDAVSHARWVAERQERGSSARYLALDVIGDADETARNYEAQTDLGALVEPTVHFPEPPEVARRYVPNASGWLNLGGMADKQSGRKLEAARVFAARIALETAGEVRLHGLGATTPPLVADIPLEATDSTFWPSPATWQSVPLFDAKRARWRRYLVKTDKGKTPETLWRRAFLDGRWLRETYGVAPAELWELSREEKQWLCVESIARFADWLRSRHGRPTICYLAGGEQLREDDLERIAAMNAER